MSGLILHDYWRSSAAYRVRIALNLKGLVYQRRPVDLRAGEQRSEPHRGLNPQGLIPVLEADGLVLTQSLAIIDWLDAAHPEPRLIPADPARRARSLGMALTIAADIHPLNNLRVLHRLRDQFGADEAARDEWYRHWLHDGLAALETIATAERGPFLGGEAPNIADLCLVPQLYNARRLELSLDAFPRLVEADAAASALPSFAEAHPDRVR